MKNQGFKQWKMSVTKAINEVEVRYDLSAGELFQASNTTDGDLRELYGYGWAPQETAMAVTEAVGLR